MISFHEDEISDGFDPKEPGRYGAEVMEVKVGATSKGDDMWTLKFNNTETDSYLCSDNLFFSEKAKGFTFKKIAMLGIKKNEGKVFELEPEDLIGCRCILDLDIEENNGDKFLKPAFRGKGFGYEEDIPV
jgi:hypothetical protein